MSDTTMLLSETNTKEVEQRVIAAGNHKFGRQSRPRAYFEHGQWWLIIIVKEDGLFTTKTYSVIDVHAGFENTSLDFEEVS